MTRRKTDVIAKDSNSKNFISDKPVIRRFWRAVPAKHAVYSCLEKCNGVCNGKYYPYCEGRSHKIGEFGQLPFLVQCKNPHENKSCSVYSPRNEISDVGKAEKRRLAYEPSCKAKDSHKHDHGSYHVAESYVNNHRP